MNFATYAQARKLRSAGLVDRFFENVTDASARYLYAKGFYMGGYLADLTGDTTIDWTTILTWEDAGDDYRVPCAIADVDYSGFASWTDVAASTTAMNAVAASSTAMNAVVASSTAMDAVIASETAMDAVAASATAMNAVAASSTAMNAVIASSTACTAIAASATAITALDNSSPVLVPQMTSNSAPSGVVSASHFAATFEPWKAFDRDTATRWLSYSSDLPQWIQYQFTANVWCYKVQIQLNSAETYRIKDFDVQYSSDGTTWTTAISDTVANDTSLQSFVVSKNSGKVAYWRVNGTSAWAQTPGMAILQFYCK